MSTLANRFLIPVLILLLSVLPLHAAQEFFPFLAEINETSVNVRAGQNKNFERICQLDKGEEVIVLEKQFSWYKIQLTPKATVYVSEKYILKKRSDQGQVTAGNVNLRAGPGINFSVIGQADEGQLVTIRDFKEGWFAIEPLKNNFGWVSESLLSFKSKMIPIAMIQVSEKADQTLKPVVKEPEQLQVQAPLIKIPEKIMIVTGMLAARKNSDPEGIYYRIEENGQIYYIKGLSFVLDNFLEFKVRVEGVLLQTSLNNSGFPLLQISKIQLIL